MDKPNDFNTTGHAAWRRRFARHAATLALAALAAGVAGQATAGCGQFGPPTDTAPTHRYTPDLIDGPMMRALYRPGEGRFLRVADDADEGRAALVGLWRVNFVSDGTAYPQPIPYGAVIDFATIQYHADGNEFQISGSRAPSTGDVCMGVWKQIGKRTYKVRHIALAWVGPDSMPPAPKPAYLGPAIFEETITVSASGDSFEGTFTLDQYLADETTLAEHIGGAMHGKRF